MPSAAPPNPRPNAAPPPDDLDNLFNYDDAVADFLSDLPLAKDKNAPTNTTDPKQDLDEEVIVRKKRAPVPKLDANLLLSPAGLPKLRKIAKTRLKFRGKGHEFSDMAVLLSAYQLWLDDLYPRAKFRDALAMVEKAGHGKRMGVVRRAWLDETKPGRSEEAVDDGNNRQDQHAGGDNDVVMSGALPEPASGTDAGAGADAPDDDELDALLAEQQPGTTMRQPPAKPNGNSAPFDVDESDDEQSLDKTTLRSSKRKGPFDEDSDDDDLDALLAENDRTPETAQPLPARRKGPFDEDEDDEDELDALLAEQSKSVERGGIATQRNANGTRNISSDEVEKDFAEDEAAMAEMDDMW